MNDGGSAATRDRKDEVQAQQGGVDERPFNPRWPLSNRHMQSVLASSGMRARAALRRYPGLTSREQAVMLDAGHGVRLQGYYTPREDARGLVIGFHGWEGSARSSYMLSTCGRLYNEGYEIFRLNFRDHGDSHHLNEEVFHSNRLGEVVGAVADILRRVPTRPVALIGFSLGGNFALRVALKAPERGLALRYVLSVCPPINPAHSLALIEQSPWFYEAYFLRKWGESLKRKSQLFPRRYADMPVLMRKARIRELTERLVLKHTDYADVHQYLDGYSIAHERLRDLHVPATLVAAVDDPVIPIADYAELQLPEHVDMKILPNGGHCGFIEDFSLSSWIEDYASLRIGRALRA